MINRTSSIHSNFLFYAFLCCSFFSISIQYLKYKNNKTQMTQNRNETPNKTLKFNCFIFIFPIQQQQHKKLENQTHIKTRNSFLCFYFRCHLCLRFDERFMKCPKFFFCLPTVLLTTGLSIYCRKHISKRG